MKAKPKYKWCPSCEQTLKAEAFAALDKNAPCKSCQSKHVKTDSTSATQEQYVVVHRRGYQRRHGTDNLD